MAGRAAQEAHGIAARGAQQQHRKEDGARWGVGGGSVQFWTEHGGPEKSPKRGAGQWLHDPLPQWGPLFRVL